MNVSKIGVIHLNQIGDLLFSLPLLKALRDAFPNAVIHSILRRNLIDLLSGSPYVDSIVVRGKTLSDTFQLLRNIRKEHYDLLITLSSSEACLTLTALSKANTKAGFSHFPLDLFLDIKEHIEGHNSWLNNRKLLDRLQVRVTKNDYVGLLNIGTEKPTCVDSNGRYAVISPGASRRRQMKTWDNRNFARLITLLYKQFGLTPVLIGGMDNRENNKHIIQLVRAESPIADIANLTEDNLRTISLVVKQAELFVGIDSGFMHVASSLDIPVVALFGPTDPFYVGPQNQQSIVVRNENLDCIPCYLKNCEHRNCMKNLTVEAVFNACKTLLSQEKNTPTSSDQQPESF
jgi:ADP-heptose:LPS heptosyltransferase